MKIVRFIVKEDKRTGREVKKTNVDSIGEEEKNSWFKEIIDQGLKRAGYKQESSDAKTNASASGRSTEDN